MIFDSGHELRGPYWVFTNLAVETGIMTVFLYTKHRERHGDADWLVISGYRAV